MKHQSISLDMKRRRLQVGLPGVWSGGGQLPPPATLSPRSPADCLPLSRRLSSSSASPSFCLSFSSSSFPFLLLLLLLLLALFVFAGFQRLGFSPAELRLAVGAGEDDARLVPLGWGGLLRPGWLWASREKGERGREGERERKMKITLLAELQSVIRLWRVSFPSEISIIWGACQCDKMSADMKVKLNMAH